MPIMPFVVMMEAAIICAWPDANMKTALNPTALAVYNQVRPTLPLLIRTQDALRSAAIMLCWQIQMLVASAVGSALQPTRTLAWQASQALKRGVYRSLNASKKSLQTAWNSRSVKTWRRSLLYDFGFFVLGSGNALALVLFWPGWLLVGGATLAFWNLLGWNTDAV